MSAATRTDRLARRPRLWPSLLVLVALGAVPVILAVWWTWTTLFPRPEGVERPDIANRIEAWAERAEPGDQLVLSEVADFAWDRVVIVAPYTANGEVCRELNLKWNVEAAPTYARDAWNLVGFVQGDEVVAWTTVSRSAELLPASGPYLLSVNREQAFFRWTGSALVPAD